jgi:hypothetical protein
MRQKVPVTMIELKYQFKGTVLRDVIVRLFDIKQVRAEDSSAPWDISVTILWGDEVAFDRPLAGIDPLHAVELAAKYASTYISDRARDENGTLEPSIKS